MNRLLIVLSAVAIVLAASTSFFLFRYTQQWQKENAQLRGQIADLQAQNKALKADNQTQWRAWESSSTGIVLLGNSRITETETALSKLKREFGGLSLDVLGGVGPTGVVLGLTGKLSDVERKLSGLEAEVLGSGRRGFGVWETGLKGKVSDLESKVSDLNQEVSRLRLSR